ncbi:hypothetical protein [Micromonospora zhanjiangensis]
MHGNSKIEQDLTPTSGADRSVETPSNDRSKRARRTTRRAVLSSTPFRIALATAVATGLGVVAVVETRSAGEPAPSVRAGVAERAEVVERQPASRASERAPLPPSPSATPAPSAKPSTAQPVKKKKKPLPRPGRGRWPAWTRPRWTTRTPSSRWAGGWACPSAGW